MLVVVNVPARLLARPLAAADWRLAGFALLAAVISLAAVRWVFQARFAATAARAVEFVSCQLSVVRWLVCHWQAQSASGRRKLAIQHWQTSLASATLTLHVPQ